MAQKPSLFMRSVAVTSWAIKFCATKLRDRIAGVTSALTSARVNVFRVKQFYSYNANRTYQVYADTLGYLNMAFTVLFSIECVLKILAFGPRVWMVIISRVALLIQ